MKLSKGTLKALQGLFPKTMAQRAKERKQSSWELSRGPFEAACAAAGLPKPKYEYQFHPERKWRFDILFRKVAVEIQGGLFCAGRHTRGAALLKEYEKLNEAQIMGYKVLLVSTKQMDSLEVLNLVKRALGK
jgi:hypothetical protein